MTLDHDVLQLLNKEMSRTGKSSKQTVNDVLRSELQQAKAQAQATGQAQPRVAPTASSEVQPSA